MTGRIIRGVGGLYTVRDADGREYVLRARGRFRREGLTPLVGDRVSFTPGDGDQHGWLDEIAPRASCLVRPPAANVSLLIIVVAPVPVPDLLLVDRLLVQSARDGFGAALVVNKCDLSPELGAQMEAQYRRTGVPVLPVSAKTGEGLPALKEKMRGELCCMAGQSATGKSTLLNALCGLALRTGEVSERIHRGRHTTRHAELLEKDGLSVLDTPGFSLLSLEEGMPPEELPEYIPEFADYGASCRFQPCLHDREPDCAVRQAIACGEIDAERHARYLALLQEVREAWKGRYS